jgi:hypothetical protein
MIPKIKIEGTVREGSQLYLTDRGTYTTVKSKASRRYPDPVARVEKGPVAKFNDKALEAISLAK